MDDVLINSFEKLQISAFVKYSQICKDINEVTIGPNASGLKAMVDNVNEEPLKKIEKGESTSEEGTFDRQNFDIIKTLHTKNEQLRTEAYKTSIQKHVKKFEEFSRRQEARCKEEWLREQEEFIKDMEQQEGNIFQAMLEYDKNNSQEHARQEELHKQLAERRRLQQEELQLKQRQKKLIHSYIDKVAKYQQEFRLLYQQSVPLLISLKEHLNQEEINSYKISLNSSCEQLEEIINRCKTGNVADVDVKKCSDIITQTTQLRVKLEDTVEAIANKQAEATKMTTQKAPQQSSTPIQPLIESKLNKTEIVKDEAPNKLSQYISMSNLKLFSEIMEFYDQQTASFKALEDDPSMKQFRFDCKRCVNIPVNSLSGINSEHILDKYIKLYNLLKGQDVLVSDKRINASQHPQGIAFCMNLLAKKFVLQGDLMASSNPESAFCYATVIISLWNEFPDFGKLVLAYFYKTCPYLVPYYIPREVGETDEEYYKKQGYQYVDGQIEKQDKFLKRMTGLTRLYAAVIIAKPKRGQVKSPHNLKHGWRWLASLLNLEPRVDITATVLHAFLETAGFQMEAVYGRMIQKLVRTIIIQKFLPVLREKCTGGAVTRLELLLTEYMKRGGFETPNGYIGHSYW